MEILKNISLRQYNSFGLDYTADTVIIPDSEDEIITLLRNTDKIKRPLLILGGGSNILFTDNFKGTIVNPAIYGINAEEISDDHVIVSSGAGVKWDRFVEWTVNHKYGGLENLSYIPGNVGAVPVQNIGAYGVEVKDFIENVKAVSVDNGSARQFSPDECEFGYRDSVFKNTLKGKYVVTRVYFRLYIKPDFKLDYGSLEEEVLKKGSPTLANIRRAVIDIRKKKLPDPEIIGNAGSFFKNPLVSSSFATDLQSKYPDIPLFRDLSGQIKLPAGWLIERCGFKGFRTGDAGVHERQALVLVNHGGSTGKEILRLSERIREEVKARFNILLEKEIEVI